jgi:cyclopropane-fatty-acyl-phospholipid synthase
MSMQTFSGNDVIESMLDKNLQYTCGYWRNAKDLDEAQLAKMDLIARKLTLKPGMRVLDIGCGFGTLAYHLAKNYGVSVVGCSVSKEQTKFAQQLCQGLPCKFLLCDYRDLNEKFDRIVSVGMFEHVGGKNYPDFFSVCNRCLTDDGIMLLHCIGIAHKRILGLDQWIHKYIFPNGYVPYYLELCKAIEDHWVIEDWHNFGFDYSKTLAEWENRFDKAWPGKLEEKYGDRFHLMWKTYLQGARGAFLSRAFQLWQIVLTKDGLPGGYVSHR